MLNNDQRVAIEQTLAEAQADALKAQGAALAQISDTMGKLHHLSYLMRTNPSVRAIGYDSFRHCAAILGQRMTDLDATSAERDALTLLCRNLREIDDAEQAGEAEE